jgi:hypothetical protein
VKNNKGNQDSKKILLTMVTILVILGLLQYQKDIYAKLSKFKLDAAVDHYEVL